MIYINERQTQILRHQYKNRTLEKGYPDMEPPIVRTHEDVVREINKQLASRPLGAPAPEIRAGGVDGLITNGGGQ